MKPIQSLRRSRFDRAEIDVQKASELINYTTLGIWDMLVTIVREPNFFD